ncbi:MAG: hypothetical protein H0T79_06785, partial [Deltaproteobacteria bacterium]|nr:hypothetical protein [Deltaproteobacteria bacterium]
ITAGKITFDGAAAQTCLAGMTATACPAYWAEGPTMPAACDGIFVGKVANGAACVVDFECSAQGSVCDPTAKTCGPDAQGARRAPRDAGLPLHLSSALR